MRFISILFFTIYSTVRYGQDNETFCRFRRGQSFPVERSHTKLDDYKSAAKCQTEKPAYLIRFQKVVKNSTKRSPDYYKLTSEDRKKYVLNADLTRIRITRDTSINNRTYTLLFLSLRLLNLSKDTLKYFSMSCSWYDFYRISDKDIKIFTGRGCDSNFPVEQVVMPQKSVKLIIPIILSKNHSYAKKFRTGMNLYIRATRNWDIPEYPNSGNFNLIWSNEITVP